jgi:FtsP/CotA-like multicopper oxidase with cupredoxin domain
MAATRIMSLDMGGAPMWQIGAEGGMWDRPVPMRQFVLSSAERADVIVDFRGFEGRSLLVPNSAPAAPVSTPGPPMVMQIRVGTSVTHQGSHDIPRELPAQRANLGRPDVTRYITLNEIEPETGSWWLNLNAAHFGKTPEYPRRDNRGLGFREPDRGHAPDAHPSVCSPGDRPGAVR